MYIFTHGGALIAVLTPIEVDESEPESEDRRLTLASQTAPEIAEPAEGAEGEEELEDTLPPELQRRGIWGFLTKRVDVKIIGPFVLVMVVVATLGSFVVINLVSSGLAQRFQNQLLDAGKGVNDTIIKLEGQQLELLRLMANTEGVDVALQNKDAAALQKLLVPLQANSNFSFVDVVALDGTEVLALRPNDPKYTKAIDPGIANWDVTKKSLAGQADQFGDKFTDLVQTTYGSMIYTGGPVEDADNKVVGAILIGIQFDDELAQLKKDVLAEVTIYTKDGQVFDSTFPNSKTLLALDSASTQRIFDAKNPQTVQRPIRAGGTDYLELVGGLVIRDKVTGGLGVSIPTSFITSQANQTRIQLGMLFVSAALVVTLIGLFLSRLITKPILILVRACQMVARGEFGDRVEVGTKDETAVLAHSFNKMVDGLRERDRIRDTFGRYMTQQVSDAILKGDVKLGGETKNLTMLMSDIRGFTTLSETMTPENLVAFLNRYFSKMIDCVLAHDGVVDKFMGDAILVVYGAPIYTPEHPINAVLTALDMRDALIGFNEELVAEGHTPIRIGIGVNTGDAVTGNIGSEARMEYTVIGDTVNATQRTEDLTKDFKTDILISETTAACLDGRFLLGEPHHITLRGRRQESAIYPVIGLRDDPPETWADSGPMMVALSTGRLQAIAGAGNG